MNQVLPLEKTTENLKTCQICRKTFENQSAVSAHLQLHKISIKKYYDQFYKTEYEGVCIYCNKPTKYRSCTQYNRFCSISCANKHNYNTPHIKKEIMNKCKDTVFTRYGTENPFQNEEVKKKIHDTNMIKYGVGSPMMNKEIMNKAKLTNIKKYGIPHILCKGIKRDEMSESIKIGRKNSKNKTIQTCLARYGTENPFQNEEVKQKIRDTNIMKYGVSNASQNHDIQIKKINTSFRRKRYTLPSGKIITLLGYEPQFLDYIFNNHILTEDEIDYSPKGIKYIDNNDKIRYYFPDFYVPKWNLIIEIKSSYIVKCDKNLYLKQKAVLQQNYRYVMIVDHNFEILHHHIVNI